MSEFPDNTSCASDEVNALAVEAMHTGLAGPYALEAAAAFLVHNEEEARRLALAALDGGYGPLPPDLFPPEVFTPQGERHTNNLGRPYLTQLEERRAWEADEARHGHF